MIACCNDGARPVIFKIERIDAEEDWMQVLLVNGSPHSQGHTQAALAVVEQALNRREVDTAWFQVGKRPVRGCIDCRQCLLTHRCAFDDDGCNRLLRPFWRPTAWSWAVQSTSPAPTAP